MLRACALMSRAVVAVADTDRAADAARGLATAGISGALVRDGSGALVGVVSQADLANTKLSGTRRHPTVSDVMTADLIGVYAEDPALAAAREMALHDIHRVVVWDADGEVVGLVSSLDVVKAIARGAEFDPAASDVAVMRTRAPGVPKGRPRYR